MYAGHYLQALPPHLLRRLVRAFNAGLLPDRPTSKYLESEAGIGDGAEALINDLNQLARVGISVRAVAAWIRAVERHPRESRRPIWCGRVPKGRASTPETPGRVYEALFDYTERSAWVSTYAYFEGPQAFAHLALHMVHVDGLRVTLLLNIQRSRCDTTAVDKLVRQLTDQFWGTDWPGSSKSDPHPP